MFETLSDLTQLAPAQLLVCAGAIFVAALVRDFRRFRPSAEAFYKRFCLLLLIGLALTGLVGSAA